MREGRLLSLQFSKPSPKWASMEQEGHILHSSYSCLCMRRVFDSTLTWGNGLIVNEAMESARVRFFSPCWWRLLWCISHGVVMHSGCHQQVDHWPGQSALDWVPGGLLSWNTKWLRISVFMWYYQSVLSASFALTQVGAGWLVLGGGDGAQSGGQWVGIGCFLFYSGSIILHVFSDLWKAFGRCGHYDWIQL